MQILTMVAAAGAIQGTWFLLSILLKFRHQKNMPLALLLIVFSLRLATIPTWREDVLQSSPWVYPLTAPLPFLFGPFLWWHIRETASEILNRPRLLIIHFVPYLFEVSALTFSIVTRDGEEYALFLRSVFAGKPPLWLPLRNGMKVLLNAAYIFFSAKIAFVKKSMRLSHAKRLWVRSLVVVPSVVLACFAYVAVIPAATERLAGGEVMPFLILSVTMLFFLYAISFLFFVSPGFSILEYLRGKKAHEELCSDLECDQIVEVIEKRFEEGAFKNPDLTLHDLSAEVNVHPNRISYAVNRCCGVSIRTLLNGKRLEYFRRKVSAGALDKQSILDLAFEAGFPSKSTFNRFFKENTGMSPSEYVKNRGTACG